MTSTAATPRCAGVAGRVRLCRNVTRHPSGLCPWHRTVARLAPRSCALCGPAGPDHRPVLHGCTVCGARTGHHHLLLVDRNGSVIRSEARCDAHLHAGVSSSAPDRAGASQAPRHDK